MKDEKWVTLDLEIPLTGWACQTSEWSLGERLQVHDSVIADRLMPDAAPFRQGLTL